MISLYKNWKAFQSNKKEVPYLASQLEQFDQAREMFQRGKS